MKKRLFAAVLALVLALGMLPATALAEETDAAPGNDTEVTEPSGLIDSQEALQAALDDGMETVQLDADITLTAPLAIDKSVTLDLAGKSIVSQNSAVCIGMGESVAADLRVIIRNGTINTTVVINAGTVTLEGLKITASEYCVMLTQNPVGKVHINSSTLTGSPAVYVGEAHNFGDVFVVSSDSRIINLNEEAEAEAETYYISIPGSEGGEVIPSTRYAAAGERVTLTARPADKHETDKITVTDIRGRAVTLRDMGKGQWSFVMPASKVEVSAVFAKIAGTEAPAETNDIPGTSHTTVSPDDEIFTGLGTPGISGIVLNPAAMPFSDVRDGDWFYNSVEYMWKHYLMSGVSGTQFAPSATTTRAMIWTILARMNNERTDINPGDTWYDRGMRWSMERGLTDGSNPMSDITREQLATMLWRSASSPIVSADLSAFSDSAEISGYALNAVRWAVTTGILNGSNGQLNPQGTATRAEVAAMAARYGDKAA